MVGETFDEIDVRILDAAEDEIDQRGIIGLRVATVADRAETTVAMIYRRFVDRDGLLAAVLCRWYRSRLDGVLASARMLLDRPGPISIDDVLSVTPLPRFAESELVHLRNQRTFVAAAENTALRMGVREALHDGAKQLAEMMEAVVDRMPIDEQFDPRIYTQLIARRNGLIDDLLDDNAISNDEYTDFLRRLLTDSTRPPACR